MHCRRLALTENSFLEQAPHFLLLRSGETTWYSMAARTTKLISPAHKAARRWFNAGQPYLDIGPALNQRPVVSGHH